MRYLFFRLLFWASWLVFPVFAFIIHDGVHGWAEALTIMFSFVFIWGRFVERYIIVERNIGQGDLKIGIISDLHLGAYKGQNFLTRLVDKINAGEPDLVLIPGDFVFAAKAKDLGQMFEGLGRIKAPTFAVLGNHDLKPTGEFSKEEIYRALEGKVKMIDNKGVDLEIRGHRFHLLGIGSLMAKDDNYEMVERARGKIVLLAHNPDSAHKFANKDVRVMICGHTHGGQIKFWPLHKLLIPCVHMFERGWHDVKGMKVFVSSGTGEVGLPLRFLLMPEVVFMRLNLDA